MSHNTAGGRTLNEIARHWFARVKEAQAHYQHAFEHQQRMVKELDQALMEGVDGSFAVAKAHRATALALNELVRVQQVLVKLVLRQEIPPCDEDEKLLF